MAKMTVDEAYRVLDGLHPDSTVELTVHSSYPAGKIVQGTLLEEEFDESHFTDDEAEPVVFTQEELNAIINGED